jgi:CheY-like chemotaxis protein
MAARETGILCGAFLFTCAEGPMTSPTGPDAARDRQAFAGKRFLVVDDHPYMIDVICEMLRHYGAADPAKAVAATAGLAQCTRRDPFDCIVCDFNMKPVNGIQALQSIRAGKLPAVARDQPFLLLTGHGDLEVVKAAKLLDVSAYVVKPVAVETFIKAVSRALITKVALRPPAHYESTKIDDVQRFQ